MNPRINPAALLNCSTGEAPQTVQGPQISTLIQDGTGEACEVRTYVTDVPRCRVYVGMKYKEAQNTGGFLSFDIDTASPMPHPFDRTVISYHRGYLQVTDRELIEELDKVAMLQNTPFNIATNITYSQVPNLMAAM